MAARPPLLSAEFLERLRSVRGLVFRAARRGDWRGAGTGPAPEFDANRPYEPGDDPRAIDWKLYARLERLWVKLHLLDRESQVAVLVDVSRSMSLPPAKRLMAARFAAAFSWLVLSAGRNLRIGAFADGLLLARGPFRSLRQFPEVLGLLGALPEGGRTRLGSAIEAFLPGPRARGFLVVLSDFFQEEDALEVLERVRQRGAALHLVQVVDDADLRPRLRGECRVADPEGGARIDLVAGEDLEGDLRGRIRAYLEAFAAASRARAVPYALARASEDFEGAFFRHVLGREVPEARAR